MQGCMVLAEEEGLMDGYCLSTATGADGTEAGLDRDRVEKIYI